MHIYYQKNQDKLKKQMAKQLKFIKSELEKETGKSYDELFEEIWLIYKNDMLERFPYIGGDKVGGTKNLTGAYCFVALAEACSKYGMTLERWGYLATLCYKRYFENIPIFIRKMIGGLYNSPKRATKMIMKKDVQNEKNALENPESFRTKTQRPTEEYPVIYHTIACPLANFADKHGYKKYMPYLCNLDYVMFEAFLVPFYREKICADGDAYCDFKIKPGANIVPSWPCHALDESDPLK